MLGASSSRVAFLRRTSDYGLWTAPKFLSLVQTQSQSQTKTHSCEWAFVWLAVQLWNLTPTIDKQFDVKEVCDFLVEESKGGVMSTLATFSRKGTAIH